jgi:eukaryotic-like serine/threonine-protein kinase
MMIDFSGQQIGSYRLLRQLGIGGFASVYQGQHVRISTQHAAIKILHLSDVDVQQFQQEAETTAALVHPNIIRLFDFDIANTPPFHEMPFLVIDYAPGGSLRTRHPQGTQLSLSTIVEYIKVLASALQFAHDRNIVHRDIKPDNILIGAQGELRLSDFGIAVLSQTGRTTMNPAYGTDGTPFYMAPEQCLGKPEKASDQYALAIMAYEWLCGHPPFTEGTAINIQFQHAFEPVPPLRQKLPQLPEVIEQVIFTALAKEPRQRYDGMLAFAQALERACAQPQTMQAKGDSLPGHQSIITQTGTSELYAWPCGHMNRAAAHFCLICGKPASLSTQAKVQASHTHLHSERQESQPPRQARYLRRALGAELASAAEEISSLNASGSQSQITPIKVQIPSLGTLLFRYTGHSDPVWSLAWSSDGRRIASASDRIVQVWNADGDGRSFIYKGHSDSVYSVAWSPDEKRIASASDDTTVQVWNADGSGKPFIHKGHCDTVWSVAWSRDRKCIASASDDKTVHVWNADGSGRPFIYRGHSHRVLSVAWSPDGKRIASVSDDKTAQVWNADGSKCLLIYKGHSDSVKSVVWSPDGMRIASASGDKTVQVWNIDGSGQPFIYKGHSDSVNAVAWSPDGRYIASASDDETVQVWNADGSGQPFIYEGHSKRVRSVAWSPDGRCLASASKDKTVQIWSAG